MPADWDTVQGLSDAPNDGNKYVRQSQGWVEETLTTLPAVSNTIYVDINGDDTNNGRAIDRPVKTISKAVEIHNGITGDSAIFFYRFRVLSRNS